MSTYTITKLLNILKDWNAGMPSCEIVAKYGISSENNLRQRILYWRKAGYAFERRAYYATWTTGQIAMLMHDWNTGEPSEHIAARYGMPSASTLNHLIDNWRKSGWDFHRRNRAYPKGE